MWLQQLTFVQMDPWQVLRAKVLLLWSGQALFLTAQVPGSLLLSRDCKLLAQTDRPWAVRGPSILFNVCRPIKRIQKSRHEHSHCSMLSSYNSLLLWVYAVGFVR